MPKNQIEADVVRAKSFVLVDDQDRDRATLSAVPSGKNGAVVLHLSDHNGLPRISLQIDENGNPSICLFTENSAPSVSLAIDKDRGNGIMVGDEEGRPCVMIGVPGAKAECLSDSPHIIVLDQEGEELWSTNV